MDVNKELLNVSQKLADADQWRSANRQFHELVPEPARLVSWAERVADHELTNSTPSSWTISRKKQSIDSKWEIVYSSPPIRLLVRR